ncbi:hypothetical protein ACRBEV_14060 [Methylobacterium phyllosphaerae]
MAPSIPIGPYTGQLGLQLLDLRMQLAGVHRQLHALILRLGQLLVQFGDFELKGEAVGA